MMIKRYYLLCSIKNALSFSFWPCLVDEKVKLIKKMIPEKMNPENMIPSNFTFQCLENIKILNLYLI